MYYNRFWQFWSFFLQIFFLLHFPLLNLWDSNFTCVKLSDIVPQILGDLFMFFLYVLWNE